MEKQTGKHVTFWYARHGQTLFNVLGRMQGWSDSPLSEVGKRQAQEAAALLSDVPLNAAFTSTSERCADTAQIILEGRDIPLHYEKGLKEMNFGTLEGTLIKTRQEEIDRRKFITCDWSDIGGENLPQLQERICRTYRSIFDACMDGDNILIVSHGAIFLHMMPVLFGIFESDYTGAVRPEDLPAPNGFAGVFTCDDGVFELQSLRNLSAEKLAELKTHSA